MEFIRENFGKIFWLVLGIAALFLVIKNYQKIKKFLLETKTELAKVSWSTRQELIGSTSVVLVITSIMAVFIGLVDLFLSKVLSIVFK